MAIGDKPTTLPEWASNTTDILEPSAGKKQSGYVFREKPGRKVLNWLLNLLYQWAAFVNTRFNADGWLNLGNASAHIEAVARTGAVDFDAQPTAPSSAVPIMTAAIVRGRSEVRVGNAGNDDEGVIVEAQYSGSGLDCEALRVSSVDPLKRAGVYADGLRSALVGTPSADFEAAFPYAESLFVNNTTKLVAQILISDGDADGDYDTLSLSGGYNVQSVAFVPGSPGVIQITPIDSFGVSALVPVIAPQPGGSLPKPVIFGAVGTAAITAIAWNGSAWVDLFGAGVATTFGGPLRLVVVAW